MLKTHKLLLLEENQEGTGLIVDWNTSAGGNGYLSKELQVPSILKEFEEKPNRREHSIFMNCILQKCDTQNRNGRYYPREILVREDKNYQELINEGRAFGESNHPDYTYISLKKEDLSHRIVKSWWENNTLMGVIEILASRAYHETGGIYCQADWITSLLAVGAKLGISSRGIGSLRNVHGKNTVQSDFELICYDLVSSPSTPGAYLYPASEVKLNENIQSQNIKNDDLLKKIKNFLP